MRTALIAAAALMSVAGATPAASEPLLGDTLIVAFNFCPKGWALMNGQLLPINQNQALFSLLGTTYGGNGQVNFALPTAKPIVTATGVALTQCIALVGAFPSRTP